MRWLVFAFTLSALGYAAAAVNEDPVVARVIDLAKERAINAEKVDWPTLESEVRKILAKDTSEVGRTRAIQHIIVALDDGHSHYFPPTERPTSAPLGRGNRPARYRAAIPIAAHLTKERFPTLIINGWAGSAEEVSEAAALVRAELGLATDQGSCGLIIDLTWNSGGNMWPMMGGIAPIYDSGRLLTFNGQRGIDQIIEVSNDQLILNGRALASVESLPRLNKRPQYIAVLLSGRTASSGEIVALAFLGQSNVRFFGQATAGQTTANWSTTLENGGRLALASAYISDRNGRVHNGPIEPDIASESPREDAAAWLAASCPRRETHEPSTS